MARAPMKLLVGIKNGIYSLCLMAAFSVLLSYDHTEALPAGARRHACRGLPASLQLNPADEVAADTTEGQTRTQRIELNSYKPEQHVIVSILEDEDASSSPGTRRYALRVVSRETGQPIGRFKTVADTTKLHHCGVQTVLQDDDQANSGVVFAWLPPHEGGVQPVTIIVAKL